MDTHLLLVANGLSFEIEMENASGKTSGGTPYLRVFLPDGVLLPGQSIVATLRFKQAPHAPAVSYNLMLLSGQGTPETDASMELSSRARPEREPFESRKQRLRAAASQHEGAHMAWSRFAAVVAVAVASAQLTAQSGPALTLDKKVLTLAAARTIVAAAEAEATRRGLGVVIVVVDDSGTVIELTRMDAAQIASVNVGIGKARTAAIYRRPSRVFEEQIRDGRVAALALADATPLQGGVPVLIGGRVVGAVGVSGDSPQVDEAIAIAGMNAISKDK